MKSHNEHSIHIQNVVHFLSTGHEFKTDEKGKYYNVPTTVNRNGKMRVTENQIKEVKKHIEQAVFLTSTKR